MQNNQEDDLICLLDNNNREIGQNRAKNKKKN